MATNPATQLAFSIHENRGVYALLLGSGLSGAASIPTGRKITLDLIRRVAMSQGEEDQTDWAAWYRDTTGEEPNYSKLVHELGRSPEERRSILDSYIEPSDEDREQGRKMPTAAHHAIADLVGSGYVRVIITTNFDRLLESALRERGVEPTVISSEDALEGAEPLPHARCYVFKLHGDYKDSRIRNTDTELANYPPSYNAMLERIFDEHGLVVCGWSGEWDDALRAAITRSKSRRYTTFWAVLGEPGKRAQSLISHCRACTIPIQDADSFFTSLRDQIETLAQTSRENPKSVELLVHTAKRFLSKPEFRIQLDDLLASEAKILLEELDASGFPTDGPWSAEEFRNRLDYFQAATESLARVFGVLGRWGAGDEVDQVVDIIRSIQWQTDDARGGNNFWLNLRSYPAVLLVTHYGVGLVHGNRWPDLHDFLSAPIKNPRSNESKRLVEKLFLQVWDGYDNRDVWRTLDGLERHKTPLSEHLFQVVKNWGESFIAVRDVEELYETWEVLGSLAYGEVHSTHEYVSAGAARQSNSTLYMPVGRSVWHQRMRARIFEMIERDPLNKYLLEAGFSKGGSLSFKAKIDNYRRIQDRE